MRKHLKVILDYDDVMNYCNKWAVEKLNHEKGTNLSYHDINGWGILHSPLDERLKYFSDPTFIRDIPIRPDARMMVDELIARGCDVYIATSVEHQCVGARVDNILSNFPNIKAENIIICSCKDRLNGDVILDDGTHNLIGSNVTYPVLFRQPWNMSLSGIPAVSTEEEFLTLIDVLMYGTSEFLDAGPKVVSIIGPSGSGKTTLVNKLLKDNNYERVISHTTREKRTPDETDYHFIDKDQFLKMKESGEFMETSSYMGEYYGTRIEDIEDILARGHNALVTVDINGALAMKSRFKDRSCAFFLNRKKEECVKSILERGLSIDETTKRICTIDAEFGNYRYCDYVLENINIADCVDAVKGVLL